MTIGNALLGVYTRGGRPCIIRLETGTYDVVAQTVDATPVDTPISGLIRSYRTDEVGGADGMILLGDRQVSADGGQFAGVVPDAASRIVVDGEDQQVIRRWAVEYGGQIVTVLWHVRGKA